MKNYNLIPILIISIIINAVFTIMLLSPQVKKLKNNRLNTNSTFPSTQTTTRATTSSKDNLFDEINPVTGFKINAPYGNLGPKMTALGVIDLEKFKSVYQNSTTPTINL